MLVRLHKILVTSMYKDIAEIKMKAGHGKGKVKDFAIRPLL